MRSYLTLLMAMVVFSLCDTSDSGCASAKRVSVNLDPVVAEKNWGNRRFWKGGKSVSESEEEERGSFHHHQAAGFYEEGPR